MPLVDSPELEDYKNGIPEEKPEPRNWCSTIRLLIGILVVVIIILSAINYAQSHHFALATGRGTITGQIIDSAGDGIPGEIVVFGTSVKSIADENGYFALSNVPQGSRTLFVGYQGQAIEYTINLAAGDTLDVGVIRLVTTLMP